MSEDVDTSGFQAIVLMLIGVLMIMLISNVLTIISNPENIKIGALVTGAVYEGDEDDRTDFIPPKFQNLEQQPIYIDVEADKLIIYPERTVVLARDLVFEGNEFEQLLDQVEQIKDSSYFVLLLRPGSAQFQRQLRKVIGDRGIDVGFEPWELGREVVVVGDEDLESPPPAAEEENAAGSAAAQPDDPAAPAPEEDA